MKVRELIESLKEFDPETEVILDADENGWYSLEMVQPFRELEDEQELCNLVSSMVK